MMPLPENIRINNGGYEVKKKGWVNKTNFTLTLTAEVQHPSDTMYIAEVRRDDDVQSTGSFALGDVYKAKDFATALNRTTTDGGNICLLTNAELVLLVRSLIRDLKEREPQYRRELVKTAGRQDDSNLIVINPNEVVNIDSGDLVSIEHTSYIWFGKCSPRPEMERHFAVPTDVQPLSLFFDLGLKVLGPEVFGVAMLAWSAMYGLNMYSWIIEHLRHFNLPLMFGEPMVGKSLIASCAAWLNGCPNTAIASRCTLSYVTAHVTNTTMPFIWDDPTTAEEVAQLAVDLGNGAVRGKTTDGETRVPKTGCLVTANFSMTDMLKYFSRIVLMVVPKSGKTKEVGDAVKLEDQAHKASSSFPLVMKEIHQTNVEEVHQEFRSLGKDINTEPRIVEGIALNILITRKVLNLAGRYNYMQHVLKYVKMHMIPYYKSQLPSLGLQNLPTNVDQPAPQGVIADAIDFKAVNRNNAVFVKKGEFLAVDQCLVIERAVLKSFGCHTNKATRLRGRARKLIHVPVNKIQDALKEDLMQKLGVEAQQEHPQQNFPEPIQHIEAQHRPGPEHIPETQHIEEPNQHHLPSPQHIQEHNPQHIQEKSPIQDLQEQHLESATPPQTNETQNENLTLYLPVKPSAKHVRQLLQPKEKKRDLCVKCKKEGRIGQCWLACDGCGLWHHKTCSGVSTALYKKLQAGTIDWFCNDCKVE